MGAHRAADPAIRARRTAFVESILAALSALPVDIEAARGHAQFIAQMPKIQISGEIA